MKKEPRRMFREPRTWQRMEPAVERTTGRHEVTMAGETFRIFQNDIYTVLLREVPGVPGWPDMVHLSIRRTDRQPVRDWRHFQNIKNDLVGPECEGVELYPAESRLMDTANQYHLFVVKAPGLTFPFGYRERSVTNDASIVPGAVQRPREES